MESIRAAFKELIVPELDRIKEENREIKAILEVTNKRLDDVNIHLADQSRRIDSVRDELSQRIDSVRNELSQRIDSVRDELRSEIKETNTKIDETNKRIDSIREEMTSRIDETNKRIDETSRKFDTRLDRLYEVIVRRDEHSQVVQRLTALERDVEELKRKQAA